MDISMIGKISVFICDRRHEDMCCDENWRKPDFVPWTVGVLFEASMNSCAELYGWCARSEFPPCKRLKSPPTSRALEEKMEEIDSMVKR